MCFYDAPIQRDFRNAQDLIDLVDKASGLVKIALTHTRSVSEVRVVPKPVCLDVASQMKESGTARKILPTKALFVPSLVESCSHCVEVPACWHYVR